MKNNGFCSVYSVQCTVYSVQCTVYSVQCTVYSVQCTVYSVQKLPRTNTSDICTVSNESGNILHDKRFLKQTI
jgi:hypothetical protein